MKGVPEPEADIEVVGEADSAESALRQVRALHPDVVLMDVRMPTVDGIEACRLIREQLPDTRVVMLTSYSNEEVVTASIMAGASGFLVKSTARAELVNGIRAVGEGKSLLDPTVVSDVIKRLRESILEDNRRELEGLTVRDREVLAEIASGKTNREIAAVLTLSENTVRNHVSRLFDKLGVDRRSGLATWWAQHFLQLGDRRLVE